MQVGSKVGPRKRKRRRMARTRGTAQDKQGSTKVHGLATGRSELSVAVGASEWIARAQSARVGTRGRRAH